MCICINIYGWPWIWNIVVVHLFSFHNSIERLFIIGYPESFWKVLWSSSLPTWLDMGSPSRLNSGVSVRTLPERFDGGGKTRSPHVWYYLMAWGPRLNKKGQIQVSVSIHLTQLPGHSLNISSCLTPLPPQLESLLHTCLPPHDKLLWHLKT